MVNIDRSASRVIIFFLSLPAYANWIQQCSQCVDQISYADQSLKINIEDANVDNIVNQVKQLRFRDFFHKEDEFVNKIFPQKQFGIIAQEVEKIMPDAVSTVPDRKWTTNIGASTSTKNVLTLRDAHLLMSALSTAQWLLRKNDETQLHLGAHNTSIAILDKEAEETKRKREEMLEQIIRAVAITEVLQKTLGAQEQRMGELESGFHKVRTGMEESRKTVDEKVGEMRKEVNGQKNTIETVQKDLKIAFEKEANADLVEKRKAADAEVDKAKVLLSIEELRHKEEQKTIRLREEEQRTSAERSTVLAKEKASFEHEQRAVADLKVLKEKEGVDKRLLDQRGTIEQKQLDTKVEGDIRLKELDNQAQIDKIKVEEETKIRNERENEDVHARHKRIEAEGLRANTLAAIRESAAVAKEWATSFRDNPQYIGLTLGFLLALVAGVYFSREMATLLREQLNKRLGRPSLIRKCVRKTVIGDVINKLLIRMGLRQEHGHEFDDVILPADIKSQVFRLGNATRNARKRNMPLLHIMFYGPPGTGKTMTAQRFAEYSGLEYAFMSGGDIAPLEEQAVTEIHKIFGWVKKSKKGVVLFIDEADAFLSSRTRVMSEHMRNALTTILYHTGTSNKKFMMILATNRPGDLDPAILDRIDESVEFGLPDNLERERLITMYYKKFVSEPLGFKLLEEAQKPPLDREPKVKEEDTAAGEQMDRDVDVKSLKKIVASLRGFSGREISKLFASLQTHILYTANSSKHFTPTQRILNKVVDEKVSEHKRAVDFIARGYNYVHNENSLSRPPTPGMMSMSGGLPRKY